MSQSSLTQAVLNASESNNDNKASRRAYAVAAAAELVAAKFSGGGSSASATEYAEALGRMADAIQAALKVE